MSALVSIGVGSVAAAFLTLRDIPAIEQGLKPETTIQRYKARIVSSSLFHFHLQKVLQPSSGRRSRAAALYCASIHIF